MTNDRGEFGGPHYRNSQKFQQYHKYSFSIVHLIHDIFFFFFFLHAAKLLIVLCCALYHCIRTLVVIWVYRWHYHWFMISIYNIFGLDTTFYYSIQFNSIQFNSIQFNSTSIQFKFLIQFIFHQNNKHIKKNTHKMDEMQLKATSAWRGSFNKKWKFIIFPKLHIDLEKVGIVYKKCQPLSFILSKRNILITSIT